MLRLLHCSPGNAPPTPPLLVENVGNFRFIVAGERIFIDIFVIYYRGVGRPGRDGSSTYEFSYNFNFVVIGKYVNLNIICAFRRVRRRQR